MGKTSKNGFICEFIFTYLNSYLNSYEFKFIYENKFYEFI